jgi:hypothetical protein
VPLVPERAIIALLPALALGFTGGIICSVTQSTSSVTWTVGIAGAVLVLVGAFSSVFGLRAGAGEKGIVGLLRALCAVGVYACMFLFLLAFLRDGEPVKALPWFVVGGLLGLALTQLRVREKGDPPQTQPADG